MNLFVSTIGTSLLTNGATQEERNFLNNLSNLKESEISKEDKEKLRVLINRAQEKLKATDLSVIQKISAELNGIISYYKSDLNNLSSECHYLITTDTYEAQQTAELIKNFLARYHINTIVTSIKNMNTKNSKTFEDGIKVLINSMYETLPKYSKKGYKIIFNLTGGFKAIQAYMNTLGMLLADGIVYLFETGKLITIPKLPFVLNNKPMLKKHAQFFAMMENDRILAKTKIEPSFFEDVSSIYYDEIENDGKLYIALSAWGILIWNEVRKEFFQNELIEYPNIIYNERFVKSFENAEKENRIRLQETLGEVAQLFNEELNISDLKNHKSMQYSDYKNFVHAGKKIGHFRVSQSSRVNCVFHENKIFMIEFGEHSIEDNLGKYKNIINKILQI